jgi:hypothetical protein
MTIGAIIGAIVAGSSLWSRRRRGRRVAHELESGPALVGSGIEEAELAPRSAEGDQEDEAT